MARQWTATEFQQELSGKKIVLQFQLQGIVTPGAKGIAPATKTFLEENGVNGLLGLLNGGQEHPKSASLQPLRDFLTENQTWLENEIDTGKVKTLQPALEQIGWGGTFSLTPQLLNLYAAANPDILKRGTPAMLDDLGYRDTGGQTVVASLLGSSIPDKNTVCLSFAINLDLTATESVIYENTTGSYFIYLPAHADLSAQASEYLDTLEKFKREHDLDLSTAFALIPKEKGTDLCAAWAAEAAGFLIRNNISPENIEFSIGHYHDGGMTSLITRALMIKEYNAKYPVVAMLHSEGIAKENAYFTRIEQMWFGYNEKGEPEGLTRLMANALNTTPPDYDSIFQAINETCTALEINTIRKDGGRTPIHTLLQDILERTSPQDPAIVGFYQSVTSYESTLRNFKTIVYDQGRNLRPEEQQNIIEDYLIAQGAEITAPFKKQLSDRLGMATSGSWMHYSDDLGFPVRNRRENVILSLCDLPVYQADGMRVNMENVGVHHPYATVLMNGFADAYFNQKLYDQADTKALLTAAGEVTGISPETLRDRPIVMAWGRMTDPRKGAADLARAFTSLEKTADGKDPLLLLIGCDPTDKNAITENIKSILGEKLDKDAFLIPARPWPDLAALLALTARQNGVMVLPSHHEPFGLVLIEAMATGCITVSTQTSAAAPSVNKAAGQEIVATCIAQNAISMAAAIQKSLNLGEEERASLREQGIETSKLFTWPAFIQQLRRQLSETASEGLDSYHETICANLGTDPRLPLPAQIFDALMIGQHPGLHGVLEGTLRDDLPAVANSNTVKVAAAWEQMLAQHSR
jgi:glycosyltransferase involved in cell wall biosynthesis